MKKFFVLLLVFISCTKDSKTPFCRLSSIESKDHSSGTTYNYNQAGQVISVSSTYGENDVYTYGKNGLVATDYYTNPSQSDSAIMYYFFYDSKNKLEKISTWDSERVFTYNSTNQIVKIDCYSLVNRNLFLTEYYFLKYNTTETKNYSYIYRFDHNWKFTDVMNNIYDSNPNPDPISISRDLVPIKTTNNLIQHIYPNGYSYTFHYTYNSMGYPKSYTVGSYEAVFNYSNCE